MARVIVQLCGEPNINWVRTPDGQKFSLGSVSPVRFLGQLTPAHQLRQLLDNFNTYGEVTAVVDLDRMWQLLKPIRARHGGHNGLFIAPLSQEARNLMRQFEANLRAAEQALRTLSQRAGRATPEVMAARRDFVAAVSKIKSPDQSVNQTYYQLGEPDVYQVRADSPSGLEGPDVDLPYDTLQDNQVLADEILDRLEETEEKIQHLQAAGRPFNAGAARSDLLEVSSKVAAILQDADLTAGWVGKDFRKLSRRANQIHALFFPGR